MQVWNVLHVARWKYTTQTIAKNSPTVHHRTTLSRHIFATKARIDNQKKIVKQQYLLHMSHNMLNFGPLTAEICWQVWGTPANFNEFRVLAALLNGTLVVGISQTLWQWTEAPPIFSRAAIMLGIGPHSSSICYKTVYTLVFHKTADLSHEPEHSNLESDEKATHSTLFVWSTMTNFC